MLCGLALYWVVLHNASFYFDDRTAIVNNEVVKKIDIPRIFNSFNTRFLVGLSFAANYHWCGLNPFGYRIINLLIHCLNAFLVYLLVKTTLYLYSERRRILNSRLEWASFFASLLFLCHPIQTEPVNSITQRFVLMGTFFYLLTLLFYIQYRSLSQKRYLMAGLGTALAAMFCKEFVITLPLMLALYDFYFLGPLKGTIARRCRHLVPFFIITLIVPLLLLRTPHQAVRVANIADSNAVHQIDITRAKGGISRQQYFLTELNVMCTYVRLLFLPINQNFDYDYPLSHKMDGRTLLSGIFLLCLLAMAKATYKSQRIVSFSILWFFITLSVESSFIPIGHVIAEYRLYLASVGFVFLVTVLIYTRQIDPKKLNLVAAVVLLGFSILTYQRNQIWKDEFTLWDDVIQKSPYKARAYLNRGLEYFRQNKFTEAISDFNKTITIDPKSAAAYNDLSVLYALKGDPVQAMSDSNKAIEIKPNYAEAYNNRALIYYQLKDYKRTWEDVYRAQALGATVNPQLINALKKITIEDQ